MRLLVFKPSTSEISRHIAGDCLDAFVDGGQELKVFDLSLAEDLKGEALNRLSEEIQDFLPNVTFFINGIGLTPPLIDILKGSKTGVVSWFTSPSFLRDSIEIIRGLKSLPHIIFISDRFYIHRLREIGLKVYHLPLSTNPKIFRTINLTEYEVAKYGCNISFVGDSGYIFYKHLKEKNLPCGSLLKKVVDLQRENPQLYIRDILNGVEASSGKSIGLEDSKDETFLELWLEEAAMAAHRKELIEEISDLGLSLYGDEGWRDLVGKGVRFFGKIDNRRALPKLYNATKINLNISKPVAKTSLPLRVFDISACGGFLLTDYRRDLSSLFEVGKEVVVYNDKDDLRRKAEYYLANQDERREIAKSAQRRVLNEHTFHHRMRTLLSVVEEIL
jgi:spore maturation protein CgeB